MLLLNRGDRLGRSYCSYIICLNERILKVKALLTERKRSFIANEVKNNKYHFVGTVLKSNMKIVIRGKIDTLTHTDVTLTFLACYIHLNKNGGVKPVLCAQTSHLRAIMRSCSAFRETEVVIWILTVILQRADSINHYLNIRQCTRPSYDIIVKQSTWNNQYSFFPFLFIFAHWYFPENSYIQYIRSNSNQLHVKSETV